MKDKIKGLVAGVMIGLCVAGGSVMAKNATVKEDITYRNIKITIDGERIRPKDSEGKAVEPFIIDGTTYLPVRAIAEALDLEVEWDNKTNTVELTTPDYDDEYYDDDDDYYYDDDFEEDEGYSSRSHINNIYKLLTCDETFTDKETGEEVDVESIVNANSMFKGKPVEYFICDSDRDGLEEVFVRYSRGDYYLVLNKEKREWVGYFLHREQGDTLKENGSAAWEDDEYIYGTCDFHFTDAGIVLYVGISIDDENKEYSIYGIDVSRRNCALEYEKFEDMDDARFKDIEDLY